MWSELRDTLLKNRAYRLDDRTWGAQVRSPVGLNFSFRGSDVPLQTSRPDRSAYTLLPKGSQYVQVSRTSPLSPPLPSTARPSPRPSRSRSLRCERFHLCGSACAPAAAASKAIGDHSHTRLNEAPLTSSRW